MKEILERFKSDIKYDLMVPPFGLDFQNMTPKQAKENFDWYMSKLPERMEYLRNRCAKDLKIPVSMLDYSPESLIVIWRWFLRTARLEKTPKAELDKMIEAAKVFGDSYINREQFSVATQFIMRDIAMYIGQVFVTNNPQLSWSYYTNPKNEVNAKQPVIVGFYYKDQNTEGKAKINPMDIVVGAAANVFDKTQKDTDIYDQYIKWARWIPKR